MQECIDAVKDIPRGLHSYDDKPSFSLPVFKTPLSDKNFQISFLQEEDKRLVKPGFTETENFK